MKKRKTAQEKAAIVAASQVGQVPNEELAKRASVPISTLYEWKRQAASNPELSAAVAKEREKLAAKMSALAEKLATRLTDIADEASFDNRASTALGIAIDKWLALTGQPNQITESRQSGRVEIVLEARRALELYQSEAGFTVEEAREALAEDDPELFRALVGEGG